jgi:hypothetical protein
MIAVVVILKVPAASSRMDTAKYIPSVYFALKRA